MAKKKQYKALPDWLTKGETPPSYVPPEQPKAATPAPQQTQQQEGWKWFKKNPSQVNKYGLVGAIYNTFKGTKPTYVEKPKTPVYAPNTEKVTNWIKSVREKGKTAQDFAKEYKKQVESPTQSGLQSFATSMTLGLGDAITKNLMSDKEKEGLKLAGFNSYQEFLDAQNKKHPVSTTIGNLAGYVAPWGAAEKIIGKPVVNAVAKKLVAESAKKAGKKLSEEAAQRLVTKVATKNLLPKVASQAATGIGVGTTEGAIAGEKPSDIAKKALEYGAFGAAGEVGISAASKLAKKAINVAKEGQALKQQGILEAFRQRELQNVKPMSLSQAPSQLEKIQAANQIPKPTSSGLVGDYGTAKPVKAAEQVTVKQFEKPQKPTIPTNAATDTKGNVKFKNDLVNYVDQQGNAKTTRGIASGDYGIVQEPGGRFAIVRKGEVIDYSYDMPSAQKAIKKDVASQEITLPTGETAKGKTVGEYTVIKKNKKQFEVMKNGEIVTTLPSMNKVRSFLSQNQKPVTETVTKITPTSKTSVIPKAEIQGVPQQPKAEIQQPVAQPKAEIQGVTPQPKAELPGDKIVTPKETTVKNPSPENPAIPTETTKFLDENYMRAVRNTRPVAPEEILADPERFQFKRDVSAKTGAGEAISDIKKWDENLAGRITIWEDKNGQKWVVNGHHRLAKAKELGVPYLDAKILREADGISAKDAMITGAKINLAEGRGTALDGAKVFREGDYNLKDLEESGLSLKEKLIKDSYNIAQLKDNVYSATVNGMINEKEAALIGKEFPKGSKNADPNQDAMFAYILKENPSQAALKEYGDMLRNADVIEGVGSSQVTFEGLGVPTITNTVENKMKLIADVKRQFSREKGIFTKLADNKNADIALKAGNVLNADENTKQKLLANMALEFIDRQKWQKGSQISDILQAAANDVVSGKMNRRSATTKAFGEIKDLINSGEFLKEKDLVQPAKELEGQFDMFGGGANEKVGGTKTSGSTNKGGTGTKEVPKEEIKQPAAAEQPKPKAEVKATPENTRNMFRGKKGSVKLEFPDYEHTELWSFSSNLKKAVKEGKPYDQHLENLIKKRLDLPEGANVADLSNRYREYIKNATKDLKAGETFKPLTIKEFEKLPITKDQLPDKLSFVKTKDGEVPQLNSKFSNTKDFNTQFTVFEKGTDKVKSKQAMRDELIKNLDVTLRYGRVQGKGTAGYFKPYSEGIRIKAKDDLPTISHEIGHYLDKAFDLIDSVKGNKTMMDELMKLGKTQGQLQMLGDRRTMMEGIADFNKHLLTGDLKYLQKNYKNFYSHFFSKIDFETFNALKQFRKDYSNLITADPIKRFKANINFYKEDNIWQKIKKATPEDSWFKFNKYWVDDLARVQKIMYEHYGGRKAYLKSGLAANLDPYKALRLYRGWEGKAKAALEEGIYDVAATKTKKGFELIKKSDSLNDILKPVRKDMEDFSSYIIAKRVLEKEGQNIKTGFSKSDAEAIIKKYGGKSFEDARQNLIKYQDVLLDKLEQSGIYNKEQLAAIRQMNKDYVPFFRQIDDETKQFLGKNKYVNLTKPLYSMKGGFEEVVNPIESVIKNTYYLTHMAEKNNAARTMVDFLKSAPGHAKYIDDVTPKYTRTQVNLADMAKSVLESAKNQQAKFSTTTDIGKLRKELLDQGIDIPEELLQKGVNIFEPIISPSNSEQIVTVFENGKKKMYQVNDKELYSVLTNMDADSSNFVLKLLNMPVNALRTGTTLTPSFAVRNAIRDNISALILSKNGFKPGVDTLKGLWSALRKDDLYKAWVSSGGYNSTMASLDRNYLQGDLKKVMSTGGIGQFAKKTVASPFKFFERLTEIAEQSTRLGEFGKTLKKAKGAEGAVQQAAYNSRDLMDFAKSGIYGKNVNKAVAFFNSSIQGNAKFFQTLKDRPISTLAKLGTWITAPSVLIWSYNNSDPQKQKIYQELPGWRKDLFWNIVQDDGDVLSFPKPFEMGVLFGSTFERSLDAASGDEKAMQQLGTQIFDTMRPPISPTLLTPLYEMATNYSIFAKRAIVPKSLESLPKEEQFNQTTSELSKVLGSITGQSPMKIDYAIKSYFGGRGAAITRLPDIFSTTKANEPGTYTGSLSVLKSAPGTKSLFYKKYQSAESIARFYDQLNKQEGSYTTAARKYKTETGMSDKEYTAALKKGNLPTGIDAEQYDNLKNARKVRTLFSDLADTQKAIMANPNISLQEKAARRDEISEYMVDVARGALKGNYDSLADEDYYKNLNEQ